jgi:hypothetical protein
MRQQYIIIDDKLDDVGIFPLVCDRPPAGWLAHHIRSGGIYCVADSAISLCRCICWCPTFVLQIATTRNAVFPYARRGPDTKQTSDAIQAKISIRALFLLYNFATVLAMPRASSRFFSQALIIERAVVSASLRVPKTVLSSGSVLPGT